MEHVIKNAHSYNTRLKKKQMEKRRKPKFVVDLSGPEKVITTSKSKFNVDLSEGYRKDIKCPTKVPNFKKPLEEETYECKININSLVDISNKLLQKRRISELSSVYEDCRPRNLDRVSLYERDDSDEDYTPIGYGKKKIPYNKLEKKYINSLNGPEREKILNLEKDILKLNTGKIPIRFKILGMDGLSLESKYNIISKLEQLEQLDPSDNEYHKLSSWKSWLNRIPFGKYESLSVTTESAKSDIKNFLVNTKEILDNSVYGHKNAKEQIIINLAKMISNKNSGGGCIAIQGPMGNGKTTLVKDGICKALNRPFGFTALGGMTDSNYLLGHDYTYEGSQPGRIAELLIETGCMNPILYFDELDKISDTPHGEEIGNLLCHLTDQSQNTDFQDKYLSGIKIDLSKILFIFSYNDVSKVNPILLDRMINISTKGFKLDDKMKISKEYLIPRLMKEYNMPPTDITFTDPCIKEIVSHYTNNEEGVRNLRRCLELLISKVNVLKLTGSTDLLECDISKLELPITINTDLLKKMIIKQEHFDESIAHLYT